MKLFNLEFKNPIFMASGTFGYGYERAQVTKKMGAIFTKGISLKPKKGNEPPRIFETDCGIINRVGLENVGVEVFIKDILPKIKGLTKIFVNITGSQIDDYVDLAKNLKGMVDGLEINVSCPNVADGLVFGQHPELLEKLVSKVRKNTTMPIVVKLTPNFCDICETAQRAVAAGADGISLINTLNAAVFYNGKLFTGGLSGPAIKPFALFCVDKVRKAIENPIIGIGGITNGQDVLDFMNVGASAVAIGSINLRDSDAGIRILREYNKLIGV